MEHDSGQHQSFMPPVNDDLPPQAPHHLTKHQAAARKKRLLIIGGAAVAGLLILGVLLWLFVFRDSKPAPAPVATTSNNENTTAEEAVTPADPTPVTFKSTKLNIELTHRKDWTLKEASDGQITLTSPRTSAVNSQGMASTNVFTLKIRNGATSAMQATLEKSIAVRDSEVIAYDAPTESQRFYTNISYGGKDADTFGFLLVTGSIEFKAGKAMAYMLSFGGDSLLIVGGYGADKNQTLAFDPVPKGSLGSDVEEQALAIIKSLKIN